MFLNETSLALTCLGLITTSFVALTLLPVPQSDRMVAVLLSRPPAKQRLSFDLSAALRFYPKKEQYFSIGEGDAPFSGI